MKIGITEAGDASLHYEWLDKINECDGIILVTKHVTDKLIEKIMAHEKKIILHATCTGMGGTIIEPNVPDYKTQLAQIQKLIDAGFPKEKITIRVDPIVPTEKGLQTAQKVINESPIRHFRFSILDTYPHVRERFKTHNIPLPYGDYFQASAAQFALVRNWLNTQKPTDIFECCAEKYVTNGTKAKIIGCVSKNDIANLGLTLDKEYETGIQRPTCHCLSCKTELLHNKKRCAHGCLYCYWKD